MGIILIDWLVIQDWPYQTTDWKV